MTLPARAVCTTCRTSSADPSLPMVCGRAECPGAALARDERAYERGEHEDRRVEREERLARLREWDIAIGEWIE